MQRATFLGEITMSDEGNRVSVRLITLLSATMALGMSACTSEESQTGPSAEASPARAAVKTYTAVDLGTLGGTYALATGINPAGVVVGYSTTAGNTAGPCLSLGEWRHDRSGHAGRESQRGVGHQPFRSGGGL